VEPKDDLIEGMKQASAEAHERREADLKAGTARIGGWLAQPDYLRAYLRGGSVLVAHAQATDTLDELAVVCGYVQRHALELVLKDVISLFYGIADARDRLADIRGETRVNTPPSNKARERLTQSHDLEQLLRDLTSARERALAQGSQYHELPADLAPLVAEFVQLEGGIAETFRYPSVRLRVPKNVSIRTHTGVETTLITRQQSFQDETIIPVSLLQSRLEALVNALFWPEDADTGKPIDSLGFELVAEDSHLMGELYAHGEL
jgi:hypothetical protein